MPPVGPITFPGTFDAFYGLSIDEVDAEAGVVRAHLDVEDHHKQPMGQVHGGVLASIAESLASVGTVFAVREQGQVGMGLSNHASFLRPIAGGTIHAEARARHRGRTTWVWEVEITDDERRLCALVRMTIAVR
jgi:uncharacterized protein (TIGR00369 family)